MVKPPRIRHSKTQREPVTIDLGPAEVKREAAVEDVAASPQTFATTGTLLDDTTKDAPAAADAEAAASPAFEPHDQLDGDAVKPGETASDGSFEPPPGASGSEAETEQAQASTNAAAPRDAAPRQEAPPRGGVSAIAAGIIGGAIALAGGAALQFAGFLPSAGVGSANVAGLEEIRAQIGALEKKIAAAEGAGAAAANQRIDALSADVDGMKSAVASLQSAVSAGGAGDAAGLQSLDSRLKALEGSVAALGSGPGEETAAELKGLAEKVAALEAADKAASAAADATAAKLSAVETRVGNLVADVEAQANNPKIALAIAAAGLKAAIDRGSPFMTELETYAAVAPDAPQIAALREMAASGVPTRAEIAAEMNAAATHMIAADQPLDPDAGFFGRFLASLESAVKVRPVGEIEGDGVASTVSRIDAAIKAGDYAKAIVEYDALPEPAKAAGADFMAKVRARQSADELVEKALASALKA